MGELNTVPMRINGVEGAAGEVKVSGGPGVLESWALPARSSQGSYFGDATVDRTIPHGLGDFVTMVIIVSDTTYYWAFYPRSAISLWWCKGNVGAGKHAVSVATDTNFYIGNAASYPESMNDNGILYYWVAVGGM